ncbi:M20 family metallo-hydrolase [Natronococcus sp. JC468]|uniref:amidohydrolase n=1 Tax=Natronococcus sp. JC468 TaxID=1961921 RepID=UPI0014386DB2|nr:M20 family metallo-hydrolase [Natronococcus sp. JC468]
MVSDIPTPDNEYLVELRRDFHRYPEPAWREFRTTARIVDELERLDVDEIHVGPDAIDPTERLGVPDEPELSRWFERAESKTDRSDVLERIRGGNTGVVAVVERGTGPTVGLRVDIDALPIEEATADGHLPAVEGFRSENDGAMHACGHDSHITFGLGTLKTVLESDFEGTFKVFFQPAEEVLGGGKPMAAGPHVEDVEYLLGVHVGLGHPTGEVVAGIDDALALSKFHVEFQGESAHAGLAPNRGRNAVQALVAAGENLYGIPRHGGGNTRVNLGNLRSENASNVIADRASVDVEVRGETTELMEYMRDTSVRILDSAAEMHDCTVETSLEGHAPREDSDEGVVDLVARIAADRSEVSSIVRRDALGASEDFTHLLQAVKSNGGTGAFVGIGTDHPGGHHTPTFDVDEDSLPIGVAVLSNTVLELLA